MTQECLECGESAKIIHPEYPGDRLCSECYGGHIEDRLDYWMEELAEQKKTGYVPRLDEYRTEDYE